MGTPLDLTRQRWKSWMDSYSNSRFEHAHIARSTRQLLRPLLACCAQR